MKPLLPWMVEKFLSLKPGGKICDSCRKHLGEVTEKKKLIMNLGMMTWMIVTFVNEDN